jgi:(p)ppGpp synthase/HD superfamily hydrolase
MLTSFSPDRYGLALDLAARAHAGQLVPGTQHPYLVHLVSVAAEVTAAALSGRDTFDLDLAVPCALLHDVLEDTPTPPAEIERLLGVRVLAGVQALTKNLRLPKEQQMPDSLARILEQPPEIARVKLADRINNLQAPPPHWTPQRCASYREEAQRILDTLGHASAPLAMRLSERIEAYRIYTLA